MLIAVAVSWLAVGAVAVTVMARRGHDPFSWAVVFLFLGPLAVPLAISADRHRPEPPPASPHDGALDVLVAHDGSAGADAALQSALDLLGSHMTSLTIAAVVDLEAPTTVRGRDVQRETQDRLDTLAGDAAGSVGAPVDTVVLFGEPSRVLQQFAAEHGYELLVTSGPCRGPLVVRGVARKLVSGSQVPVLVGPAPS